MPEDCKHQSKISYQEWDDWYTYTFQCLQCFKLVRETYENCQTCGQGKVLVKTEYLDAIPGYGFDKRGWITRLEDLDYWQKMEEWRKLPLLKRLFTKPRRNQRS